MPAVRPQDRPFHQGTLFAQVPRSPSPRQTRTAVWGSNHEAFIGNPFPGGTSAWVRGPAGRRRPARAAPSPCGPSPCDPPCAGAPVRDRPVRPTSSRDTISGRAPDGWAIPVMLGSKSSYAGWSQTLYPRSCRRCTARSWTGSPSWRAAASARLPTGSGRRPRGSTLADGMTRRAGISRTCSGAMEATRSGVMPPLAARNSGPAPQPDDRDRLGGVG